MKVAIAFLFVALNCYIVQCNVFGNKGLLPKDITALGGIQQESVKNEYTATGGDHAGVPTIPKDCLEKLIKVGVPETLKRLQEVLCLFFEGKKAQSKEIYKAFLEQVHEDLIDAGCAVDDILSTKDFLKNVGDSVGEVAEEVGMSILELVEDLGVSEPVMNCLCGALGETLKSMGKSLGGSNGAADILNGLPIIG